LLSPEPFAKIISPPLVSVLWLLFSVPFLTPLSFFSLLPVVLPSLSSALLRELAFAYLARLVFLFDPYPSLSPRLLLPVAF